MIAEATLVLANDMMIMGVNGEHFILTLPAEELERLREAIRKGASPSELARADAIDRKLLA